MKRDEYKLSGQVAGISKAQNNDAMMHPEDAFYTCFSVVILGVRVNGVVMSRNVVNSTKSLLGIAILAFREAIKSIFVPTAL